MKMSNVIDPIYLYADGYVFWPIFTDRDQFSIKRGVSALILKIVTKNVFIPQL